MKGAKGGGWSINDEWGGGGESRDDFHQKVGFLQHKKTQTLVPIQRPRC